MVFFYVIVCVCVCFSFNETASDDFLLRQLYLYADMLFCVRHILSFPLFSLLLFPPFSVRAPQSGCTCTKLSYSDSFFFFVVVVVCIRKRKKNNKDTERRRKKALGTLYSVVVVVCLFVWPDFCYFPGRVVAKRLAVSATRFKVLAPTSFLFLFFPPPR